MEELKGQKCVSPKGRRDIQQRLKRNKGKNEESKKTSSKTSRVEENGPSEAADRKNRRQPKRSEKAQAKRGNKRWLPEVRKTAEVVSEPEAYNSSILTDDDLQLLLNQIDVSLPPFKEVPANPGTVDIQRLLESFIAATELSLKANSEPAETNFSIAPPSATTRKRSNSFLEDFLDKPVASKQCDPKFSSVFGTHVGGAGFDTLSRNSQPASCTHVPLGYDSFTVYPENWDDNEDDYISTAPPPGVISRAAAREPLQQSRMAMSRARAGVYHVLNEGGSSAEYRCDDLNRKLISPNQHTPTMPVPQLKPSTAEEKRLVDYQTSFPILGSEVAKGQQMSPRPLTEFDRSTLSTSSSQPLKWATIPADVDTDGMWMTASELDYVLRQHLAQTTRAQIEITRPKTIEHEVGASSNTEGISRFIHDTPPRGCICALFEHGGFGLCRSPWCTTTGKDNSEIRRAIASRIDLGASLLQCRDLSNEDYLDQVLFILTTVDRRTEDLSPAKVAPRLIDLGVKEQGRRTLVELWLILTITQHSGRIAIMNGFLRNVTLLTSICRESTNDGLLNSRLDEVSKKYLAWDGRVWEHNVFVQDLNKLADEELKFARATTSHFVRLGLLLMKNLSDVIRGGSGKLSLATARVVYTGIEEGIMDLARSLGTCEITDGLMKHALLLHPALLPAFSSALFLSLMTMLYICPVNLHSVEYRGPVDLARAPLTTESAYRLLFRLVAMTAVHVLDHTSPGDASQSAATAFLRTMLITHASDHFCAAALHEAASSTQTFGSAEELVLWLCP